MQEEAGLPKTVTDLKQAAPEDSAEGGVEPDEALAQAISLHRRGHAEPAAEIYRRILAVVPEHIDALHYLGVASHQLGKSQRPSLC